MKSETFKLRINMNLKKKKQPSHICNTFISPYAV